MACVVQARPASQSPESCDPGVRLKVTATGDSIMAGNFSDAQALLQADLGTAGYAVQGCAVGGNTIANVVANYNTYAASDVDIVVWEGGVNNIVQGASGAATWALAEAQLNLIRAEGRKVVAVTISPCGGYSGCGSSSVDAYNAALTSWCTSQGPTNCQLADTYTALGDVPTAPHQLKPIYIDGADFIHPNALGTATGFVPVIADAVRAL